ncbi:transposase [Dysgonomonas gadei]|uniref:Transposase IS116/IS110/IS902 C-terminal domain-containing protein n=1 Tax=Dysgonomonas gadei ATCC BAA-286 TaxID=742766 RepID=F5IWV9_9BACT|nr:transposase [Dysgonomonas gadei]EGK02306.1 hypothetical protein HMPREF9455_01576 [Dysgonomonas gadei ATCC BAA-286]
MGIQRKKSDKIDSEQLALYAYHFRNRAKQYSPLSKGLRSLQLLYAFRGRLIKSKVSLSQASIEMRAVIKRNVTARFIYEKNIQDVRRLEKEIKYVEHKMLECIEQGLALAESYKLLTSIIGIAFVNASVMIIYTGNLTRFINTRQYACYTDMAPFGKSSGSSKNFQPQVSKIANKELKSLLTQAAKCAARHDPDLREYYNRKKEEGKQGWLIINNIRNKLIHRTFAVIERREPYCKDFSFLN